jgi:hypothetical protein
MVNPNSTRTREGNKSLRGTLVEWDVLVSTVNTRSQGFYTNRYKKSDIKSFRWHFFPFLRVKLYRNSFFGIGSSNSWKLLFATPYAYSHSNCEK